MFAVCAIRCAVVGLLIALVAAAPASAETSPRFDCPPFSIGVAGCLDLDAEAAQENWDTLPVTFTVEVPEGFCDPGPCNQVTDGYNLALKRDTTVVSDLSMSGGAVKGVNMSVDNFHVFGPRDLRNGQTIRGIRTTFVRAGTVRDIFVGGNDFSAGEVLTVTLRDAQQASPRKEFRVSGRVTDAEGAGFPDRRVAIDPLGGGRTRGATTDDNGEYSRTVPDAGRYEVSVRKERQSEPVKVTACGGNTRGDSCVVSLTRNRRSGRASFRIAGCPLGASAAAEGKACPIVVNDNGNRPDHSIADKECDVDENKKGEQCTLRAAILEANTRSGKDKIVFAIRPRRRVPEIVVTFRPLPALEEPAILDATTQGDHVRITTPPSGGDIPTIKKGLQIKGGDTTIRGLSVDGFLDQIVITGRGENVVRGNITRPGAAEPDPDSCQSAHGGLPFGGQGFGAGLHVDTGGLNRIVDNKLAGGCMGVFVEAGAREVIEANKVEGLLAVVARSDIGGRGKEGNEIGGGLAVFGDANVIQGNSVLDGFGTIVTGSENQIGGTGPGEGNVFGRSVTGLDLTGARNRVQGNSIGVTRRGRPARNSEYGIRVQGPRNRIGGPAAAGTGPRQVSNRIVHTVLGAGIFLTDAHDTLIQNNFISKNGRVAAIWMVFSHDNRIVRNEIVNNLGRAAGILIGDTRRGPVSNAGDRNLVRGNDVTGNGGPGIAIRDGVGNAIDHNVIARNDLGGIDLGDDGFFDEKDVFDGDDGPNRLQNAPQIQAVFLGRRTVRVKGVLQSAPGRSYTIDFFDSKRCESRIPGPGRIRMNENSQGDRHLAQVEVRTNAQGDATFDETFPATKVESITATAKGPGNNTSEFAPCARQGGRFGD